jgi:hypothetical protein
MAKESFLSAMSRFAILPPGESLLPGNLLLKLLPFSANTDL